MLNINGIDYTFDGSGVWIPDAVSHMKGRVYRNEDLNIEFTVPDYFEIDITPIVGNVTCKDDRGSYYFYVSLRVGKLYFNMTVDDAVGMESSDYKRYGMTVNKSKITINNREYIKLTALDTEDTDPPGAIRSFGMIQGTAS